ncbi:MAG: hypothetical protein ACRDQA_12455 [Nocardioidaceae bacterium]
MVVDTSAPEVEPPVVTTSADGHLSAYTDTTNAGVLLVADRSGGDPAPVAWRFTRDTGSGPVPVRSGDTATSPGGVGIAYDHEAPLGYPIAYTASPIFVVPSLTYSAIADDSSEWGTYYHDGTGVTTDWSAYPIVPDPPDAAAIDIPIYEHHVSSAGITIGFDSQPAGTQLTLSADVYFAGGSADTLRTRWGQQTEPNIVVTDANAPDPNTRTHVSRTITVPDGETFTQVQLYIVTHVTATSANYADVSVSSVTNAEVPTASDSTVAVTLAEPSAPYDVWVKSTVQPSDSALVRVTDWGELSHAGRTAVTSVIGRTAPAARTQKFVSPTSTITILAEGNAVETVRDLVLSADVLLLQTRKAYHRPDQFVVATNITESVVGYAGSDTLTFACEISAMQRPDTSGAPYRMPGWTLADMAGQFDTYADAANTFDTYLDAATNGVA